MLFLLSFLFLGHTQSTDKLDIYKIIINQIFEEYNSYDTKYDFENFVFIIDKDTAYKFQRGYVKSKNKFILSDLELLKSEIEIKYKNSVLFPSAFKKLEKRRKFINFKISNILTYKHEQIKYAILYFEAFIVSETGAGGEGVEYIFKQMNNLWVFHRKYSVMSIN